MATKGKFQKQLTDFVVGLQEHISTEDGQWTIKGFIDVFQNVYTISSDTKIVSKILEIHLFPKIMEFAKKYDYKIVLAEHQNYYPDISFVKSDNEEIRFAVDFKTTYRNPEKPYLSLPAREARSARRVVRGRRRRERLAEVAKGP